MVLVSLGEARAGFSRLIDRAVGGEEVVITRQGTPVARLVPVGRHRRTAPTGKRPLGVSRGLFPVPPGSSFFDPLPDDIVDAFYGGPIFPDDEESEAER